MRCSPTGSIHDLAARHCHADLHGRSRARASRLPLGSLWADVGRRCAVDDFCVGCLVDMGVADMSRLYVYAAIVAATLGLAAWSAASIYSAGKVAGAAECEKAHADAAAAAQAETNRREQASDTAASSILDYLAAQLPIIETVKYETVERVRTIYRDMPVPTGCVRPPGVQAELDQARQRANVAARGLRGRPGSTDSANPSAVGDGPMGSGHDGDL